MALASCVMVSIAIAMLAGHGHAQLDCIVAPPCVCNGLIVDCKNRNLTSIPTFSVSTRNYTTMVVDLSGNRISDVPPKVFANLSTTNSIDIRIYLSANQISDFSVDAFDGINNSVTELVLHDNKLTTLPKVLSMLPSLQTLSIYKNGILAYDESIMQALGPTLKKLLMGGGPKRKWTTELRYLFILEELSVLYDEQDIIPSDAFLGFEKTLTSLQLEYSNFVEVPRALCNLENLISFSFSGNEYLSSFAELLPNCSPKLSAVRTAIIAANNIKVFPTVFETFPQLTTLKVINNTDLLYIDHSAVTEDSSLVTLDLSGNGLVQFPEALYKLNKLERLNLGYNKIELIEEFNIPNLTSLTFLDLSGNPISHIVDSALRQLVKLETLLMDDSVITTFPKAFRMLPVLKTLSLQRNRILCSCDMKWILTDWERHDEVAIGGTCGTSSLTLADYISKYLPNCAP